MEKVTLRYLLIEKSGWGEEGTQLPRRHKKNKRLYKKHSSIVRQGTSIISCLFILTLLLLTRLKVVDLDTI